MKESFFRKLLWIVFSLLLMAPGEALFSMQKMGVVLRSLPEKRVGMVFNLSEKVFLRTSLGYVYRKNESGFCDDLSNCSTETSCSNIGAGVFQKFLGKKNLDLYMGLEVNFFHLTSKGRGFKTSGNGTQLDGIVGAQVRLSERLIIFAEASLGYYTQSKGEIQEFGLANSGVGLMIML